MSQHAPFDPPPTPNEEEPTLYNPSNSNTPPAKSDEERADEKPPTLYNPSAAEAPSSEEASTSSDEEETGVPLTITLSLERMEQLRSVAEQLGLSPSLLAARATELVCNAVVTIDAETYSRKNLIERYQARLDLLHAVESVQDPGKAS